MNIEYADIDHLPAHVIKQLNASEYGFFTSVGWYKNFIDTVASQSDMEVRFYYSDNDAPIVLPLMYGIENKLRVIKSLTNYYSPIYAIEGLQQPAIVDFFKQLKTKLPAWDIMELRPLSFEDTHGLQQHLTAAGFKSTTFFCFGNWYLNLENRSFDAYFTSLASQLKNTVNRKSKKFLQIDGARIEIISGDKDLERAIAAYHQVYQSSWKVQEPYQDFMPGLIKLANSVNGLRLAIAYLNDVPIAAQFWIVADKTAYIFKLAYDENYKQYSAGTILTTQLMKHVIDVDKVEVIDYLCGDDSYKKDWMSERRERWGILIFNTATPRGFFEYSKEAIKSYVKPILARLNKNKPQ